MKGFVLKVIWVATFLPTILASAQWVLETIEKPVQARELDGYVRIVGHNEAGEGIPDIRVEECDKAWKRTLGSTVTGKDGHFHLEPTSRAAVTHYIRISGLGFNTRLYTVKLSKHGSPNLNLEINPAA